MLKHDTFFEDSSRGRQEASGRSPRGSQEAPNKEQTRWKQEQAEHNPTRPKTVSKQLQDLLEEVLPIDFYVRLRLPLGDHFGVCWSSKIVTKNYEQILKMLCVLKTPQEGPKKPEKLPERLPREEAPKGHQDGPIRPQDVPSDPRTAKAKSEHEKQKQTKEARGKHKMTK